MASTFIGKRVLSDGRIQFTSIVVRTVEGHVLNALYRYIPHL
jgi:hypothetical protein